jgi:hypothetical protein
LKPSEQLFYDQARMEDMGLERQVTLFFEPTSEVSRGSQAVAGANCGAS